jgi:tRNA dimethylallyltransferase
MLEQGALEEVRALLPRWAGPRPAFRALGAEELRAHLLGDLSLGRTRPRSRRLPLYAKRQRTWFRSRMAAWTPIRLPDRGRITVTNVESDH